MQAQMEVKAREEAQNYPLIAEIVYSKTIVHVLAIHDWIDGRVCWCEVKPSRKLVNVPEKDLRFFEPERGRSA